MPQTLHVQDLIDFMTTGFFLSRRRRLGLEYERVGVLAESGEALPYDGPRSVVAVLTALAADHGWTPVGTDPLLEVRKEGTRLTLEPGSQLEISARPHATLDDARDEIREFLVALRAVSDPLGILWLPLGLQPLTPPEGIVRIPKERYRIMEGYLPGRGALATWMMKTSAGMQINLDVADAADATRKLRLALRVGSVVTALFANSPLAAGRENGWASRRARLWLEVDDDRCGLPEPCLRPDAGLAEYVDWALDAGMFFLERGDDLIDATGTSFRSFLSDGLQGLSPTLDDWELHLTTLFPEARLKSYLEIRGGDSNRVDRLMAYAALWQGLIYGDADVEHAALELTAAWSYEERVAFHTECARSGLAAAGPDGRLAGELAGELVVLAERGLPPSDRAYLDAARAILETGRTPADEILDGWRGRWAGSVTALAAEIASDDGA